MTQPGKFDPSFVDPTEKVSQQNEKPIIRPVTKKDEGTKQKFKNVLDKKLEQIGEGEDVSQEVGANASVGQSGTLFDLASVGGNAKGMNTTSMTVDDLDLLSTTNIDLLEVDTNQTQTMTAAQLQQLANLKKQFPVIPEPHELYQVVKNEDDHISSILVSEDAAMDTLSLKKDWIEAFSKTNQAVSVNDDIPLTPVTNTPLTPPLVVNTASISDAPVPVHQESRIAMVELVDKLVSNLVVISQTDRTDTQITLQYPPIFAGATLVVTEFNSSKQQFNLTFFNLSPDARALIANVQNQVNLRNSLIERGYMLQMVTIESTGNPPLITTNEGEGVAQGQTQQRQTSEEDTDTVT